MFSIGLLLVPILLTLMINSDVVESTRNQYPAVVEDDYSHLLTPQKQLSINKLKLAFVNSNKYDYDQSSEDDDVDEDSELGDDFPFINQKITQDKQSKANAIAQTLHKYLQEKSTSIDEILAADSQLTSTTTPTPINTATKLTTSSIITSPPSTRNVRVINRPIAKALKFNKKAKKVNRNRQSPKSTKQAKSKPQIYPKNQSAVKKVNRPPVLGHSVVAANDYYLKNQRKTITTKSIVPTSVPIVAVNRYYPQKQVYNRYRNHNNANNGSNKVG